MYASFIYMSSRAQCEVYNQWSQEHHIKVILERTPWEVNASHMHARNIIMDVWTVYIQLKREKLSCARETAEFLWDNRNTQLADVK